MKFTHERTMIRFIAQLSLDLSKMTRIKISFSHYNYQIICITEVCSRKLESNIIT